MTTPKIVNGEVVEETITGRLVRRVPEPQQLSTVRKHFTPEQQAEQDRLFVHVDLTGVEQLIFNSYAGGYIGLNCDEDYADAPEAPLPPTGIILTDKD